MNPDLKLRLLRAADDADGFTATAIHDALEELERLWDEQPAPANDRRDQG